MTGRSRTRLDETHERQLIDAFVADAAELPPVRDIWIEVGEAIEVTVVVNHRDDLAELRLFAMFHPLSQSRTRTRCGGLEVVTEPYTSSSATRHRVR